MENPLVEAMLRDLRAFAGHLADVGAAPEVSTRARRRGPASVAWLLWAVDNLAGRIPGLAGSLETRLDRVSHEVVAARSPRRARLSRRPGDYVVCDGRLVPDRWERVEEIDVVDRRPLRWLLHLLDLQLEHAEYFDGRIGKYIDEIVQYAVGTSDFARDEVAALRALQADLDTAKHVVQRSRAQVLAASAWSLTPSLNRPNPYPRTPEWSALRFDAELLSEPHCAAAWAASELRGGTAWSMADVPFLYQRWCGLKLVQRMLALGWSTSANVAEALLLGGVISFSRAQASISLWVEPRITSRIIHASGLRTVGHRELSPDLVFVVRGPHGPDAFVLDPTMQTAPSAMEAKGKYLFSLAFDAPQQIAGTPTSRVPRRAWACAPLRSSNCQLFEADGRVGAIPMNPLSYRGDGLMAWIDDLVRWSVAWSSQGDAARTGIRLVPEYDLASAAGR